MNIPLVVRHGRVIFGGPTVGKSYLARALRLQGANVMETDDIVWQYEPSWFQKRRWETAGPAEHEALDRMVGSIASQWLARDPHAVLLSNMYSLHFREPLRLILSPFEGVVPVGVVRASHNEIATLSNKRGGGGIPSRLALKWVDGWRRHLADAVMFVVVLPPSKLHFPNVISKFKLGAMDPTAGDSWKQFRERLPSGASLVEAGPNWYMTNVLSLEYPWLGSVLSPMTHSSTPVVE